MNEIEKSNEYWLASTRLTRLWMDRFENVDYERLQEMLHQGELGNEMEQLAKITIDELWERHIRKKEENE